MRYDKEGHPIVDNLDQVDGFISDRKRNIKKDNLSMFKDGTVQIDHLDAANKFIHFINSVPTLDKYQKQILIMRIGSPAMKGKKMSHMAIALALGMSEQEARLLEKVAMSLINEHLGKVSFIDGVKSNSRMSMSKPNEALERVSKTNNQ